MKIHELYETKLLEYRIYNKSSLDKFLNQYTSKLSNNQHISLFNRKFRKLIVNDNQYLTEPNIDIDKNIDKTNLMLFKSDNKQLKDQLDHIFDMIRDPDLSNNQFKKLTGVQSIDQAYQIANNYFDWKNKQASDEEDYPNLKEIMSFSDGFKIVQLKSKKCLDREGKLMSHCVGSYGEEVENEGLTVLSLRDSNNNPHATIGIENEEITEIKGKGNEPIIEKYRPYIRKYLNKTNYEVDANELLNIGLMNINDKFYDYNNLPEGLIVKTNLNLSGINIKSLPNNLEVKGNLDITNTNITSLPDNLKVDRQLNISNTNITSLPDNLKVRYNLSIRHTNIKSIPNNLEVGNNLLIENSKLSKRYTKEEIKRIAKEKGGYINKVFY